MFGIYPSTSIFWHFISVPTAKVRMSEQSVMSGEIRKSILLTPCLLTLNIALCIWPWAI